MKLKAILAAGLSALALSGVLASTAGAAVPLTPSKQEMAEHPGMGYSVRCDISEWESKQLHVMVYLEKANAEGKCTATWEVEPPLPPAANSNARRHRHHRHHRARR